MVIAIGGALFQQQVRSFAEERRIRQAGSLRERTKSGNSNFNGRCDCRVNAAVAETERNSGSREKPREAD
ncbi:hypothetical protein R1flu_004121 [Riccia fluitans]|uniref:Uncharacterized protein n=1 Tax=Riccia fluitans TaxID=41844 RepID=A0ABD1YPE1_9MARC